MNLNYTLKFCIPRYLLFLIYFTVTSNSNYIYIHINTSRTIPPPGPSVQVFANWVDATPQRTKLLKPPTQSSSLSCNTIVIFL